MPTTTELLTTAELSAETGIASRTLSQWRYLGEGPAYVKLGAHVRYPRDAVERWLAERTVRPGERSEIGR